MNTIAQAKANSMTNSSDAYPLREAMLDIYYPCEHLFFEIVPIATAELLTYATGSSLGLGCHAYRLGKTVGYAWSCLFPNRVKGRLLSPETIENGQAIDKKAKHPLSKQRYYYVLARVRQIAKKMELTTPIEVYAKPGGGGDTNGGSSFSLRPVPLRVGDKLLRESNEEIDFVVAHELAHIKNNENSYQLFSSSIIWVIDALCLIHCPPLLFLVEAVSIISEDFFPQKQNEKAADLLAMKTLNTNRGAIKYFTKSLEKMLFVKRCIIPRKLKGKTVAAINDLKDKITPQGNLRDDHDHPPVTERLAYCRAFVPQKA